MRALWPKRANLRTLEDPLGVYWVGGYNAAALALAWATIEYLTRLRAQWAVPGVAETSRAQVEQIAGTPMTNEQMLAWLDGVEAVGRLV